MHSIYHTDPAKTALFKKTRCCRQFNYSDNHFTVRRDATATSAVVLCLSVYLSQVCVLPKQRNIGWYTEHSASVQWL